MHPDPSRERESRGEVTQGPAMFGGPTCRI